MKKEMRYSIGLDINKKDIDNVMNQLKQLQNIPQKELLKIDSKKTEQDLLRISLNIRHIQDALKSAYNVKINSFNVKKFNKELQESKLNINSVYQTLHSFGSVGDRAFRSMSTNLLTANVHLRESHKLLDKMAITMANTVRYGISSSIFNNLTNSIQKAYDYTVKLDSSLNDIRIVTNKSAEDMERFARVANNSAKQLGASTRDYTEASLIYYQQGLNDQETKARTDVTLKAANVTGQEGRETSEQLTAIWNGYKVSAEETELYIDKVAKVAATTASDLEELSKGMGKVASAANSAGVDIDQLNATLATVISVTREAPETIGTSFKTIYARMGDLAVSGEDEFGVSLGKVSQTLHDVGIEILDQDGQMRDMGEIVEETADKWQGWTRAQRQAAAVAIAGKRQYSRLIALFDNWDMYEKALATSKNAMGALQEQQDIYMDRTEAHLQTLQTSWEGLFQTLSDQGTLNVLIDGLTSVVKLMDQFGQSIGGGIQSLSLLGTIGMSVFNKQLAKGLGTTLTNRRYAKEDKESLESNKQMLQNLMPQDTDSKFQSIYDAMGHVQLNYDKLSADEINDLHQLIKEQEQLLTKKQDWEQLKQDATSYINEISKETFSFDDIQDQWHTGVSTMVDTYDDAFADMKAAQSDFKKSRKENLDLEDDIDNFKIMLEQAERFKKNTKQSDDSDFSKAITNLSQIGEKSSGGREKALERIFKGDKRSKNLKASFDRDIQIIEQEFAKMYDVYLEKSKAFNRVVEGEIATEGGPSVTDKLDDDIANSPLGEELKKLSEKEYAQSILDLTNGILGLGSAFLTLSNIPKIFTSEDLSTGEKVLQIIMALTTAVSLLADSVSKLNDARSQLPAIGKDLKSGIVKAGTGIQTFVKGGKAAKAGMDAIGASAAKAAAGTAAVGASTTTATAGTLSFGAALGTVAATALGVGLAIGAVALAIYGLVKWYNKDADAAKKAAETHEDLTKTLNSEKQELADMEQSFEKYDSIIKKIEEAKKSTEGLTKDTKEYKDMVSEANQQIIDLVKSNRGLAKYVTRNKDDANLLEFKDKDKVLDIQKKRVQMLQNAENIGYIQDEKAALKSQATNLKRKIAYDTFDTYPAMIETTLSSGLVHTQMDQALRNEDILNKQLPNIIKSIQENGFLNMEKISEFSGIKGNKELIESINNSKEALEEHVQGLADLNDSTKVLISEGIKATIDQDKSLDKYDAYEKSLMVEASAERNSSQEYRDEVEKKEKERKTVDGKDYYGDSAFGGGNEDQIHKDYAELKGYKFIKDKLGDKAIYEDDEGNEKTVSDDAARRAIQANNIGIELSKLSEEEQKNLTTTFDALAPLKQKYGEQIFDEIIKSIKDKDHHLDETIITPEIREQLLGISQEKGNFTNGLKGLTNENWGSIGVGSFQDFFDKLNQSLEIGQGKYDAVAGRRAQFDKLGGAADDATALYDGIQSGDITSENINENESYAKVKEQLESLKATYPEVTAASEILSNSWLVGTQTYTEALGQVQDALYKAKVTSLTEAANEKIDNLQEYFNKDENKDLELSVLINSDEFEKNMDDILNAEYAIDVAIHAEAESEFDDITNAMNDISTQASKIGENFVVSADDVRELNNTFPGIIEGMRSLNDGTIQLNEEAVDSAIRGAQAEVAADSQATINKLQNQATLLRNKQAIYKNLANAARVLAQSEVSDENTAAEQKGIINGNLTKLKELNNDTLTDLELKNDVIAADSSKENGRVTAQNWNEAYQEAAKASYSFATAAIQNNKAAAGEGQPTKGNFSVNYKGSSGVSSEAAAIGETQKALDSIGGDMDQKQWSAQWNSIANKYDDLAESAGAAANDIDGMIAQIGSKNNQIKHDFGNIRKGHGKNDKSKNGGGKSKKDPQHEELLDKEHDPYHDIDIIIKDISHDLSLLQKQQDKFFGQKLINNLNKQWELLQKQIEASTEKITIAKNEANKLKGELSGKGVNFNADGTISNYVSAYQTQLEYVNGLISRFNAMTAEEQERFKPVLEKAKKDFAEFEKNIQEYDKTVNDIIPGLESEIEDQVNKQLEIQIKKFNMEIEIRLNLAEAERDWNDFKKTVIDQVKDEDIFGNTKAKLEDFSSYYKQDGTGVVQANAQHLQDILNQLHQIDNTGTSSVYGDNKNQALEDLKHYYDELTKDLRDIESLQEEIHQSYISMMDEAQEKFDAQVETYEQITSLIEHDMAILQLLKGEESYVELDKYYEKQQENYRKQLDFQRQQKDFWKEQMDAAEKGSEQWEVAKANWMSAVDEWKELTEASLENITDKYLNAINIIFEKLNNKVTDGKGLSYVEEEWTLINQNAEQYLDTINAMYGMQEVEKKYLDAIDKTDNIGTQRKLNELMQEEMKALQEKDKLTQYDIDRAKMKYEIALKQIALEEAQQNKSQLRLRRDSQGNYSYQFVSDEDEIGNLRDELSQLQNQLYNFDLERYKENLDQVYNIWAEYQEKMKEAAQINDPQKRAERELLLNEQYGELINGLVAQNEDIRLNLQDSAFSELANLYETDLQNFEQLSQDEKNILLEDMIPQWTSGVQNMADVFAGEGGFSEVCKDAMLELKDATAEYEESLQDTMDTAGTTFDDIVNGEDEVLSQTENLLDKNEDLINNYERQLDAIKSIIQELNNLILKYTQARNAAISASDAAYKYWQEQQRQAAEKAHQENVKNGNTPAGQSSNNQSGGGRGSNTGGGSGDGVPTIGESCIYTGGTYYSSSTGGHPIGHRGAGKRVTITRVIEDGRPYPIHVQSKDSAYGWLKRSQLKGFDTGGYTGQWNGSDGRLAMLHQKEIVLNREDTKNLLETVKVVRNVVNSIGNSVDLRTAALGAAIGITSENAQNATQSLEQNVHIDAHFPNVEKSKEIEDAFDNLMNIATQRIHRQ